MSSDDVEVRSFGAEIRAEATGRTITGIVMPYGKVSPSHREQFQPGSLRPTERGLVHVAHDRSQPISGWPGAVELRDTDAGLEVTINVDDNEVGNKALAEVRAGKLTSLSIEFNRAKSTLVNGIRTISDARLFGVGLVTRASYSGTGVQVRNRKRGAWIT